MNLAWRRVDPLNRYSVTSGGIRLFWGDSFSTGSVVCWNGTLRSSSPWIRSTGERQFAILRASEFIERKPLMMHPRINLRSVSYQPRFNTTLPRNDRPRCVTLSRFS